MCNECAICLNPLYNKGGTLKVKKGLAFKKGGNPDIPELKCNHKFHNKCLREWYMKTDIASSDSCPLCRNTLIFKSFSKGVMMDKLRYRDCERAPVYELGSDYSSNYSDLFDRDNDEIDQAFEQAEHILGQGLIEAFGEAVGEALESTYEQILEQDSIDGEDTYSDFDTESDTVIGDDEINEFDEAINFDDYPAYDTVVLPGGAIFNDSWYNPRIYSNNLYNRLNYNYNNKSTCLQDNAREIELFYQFLIEQSGIS